MSCIIGYGSPLILEIAEQEKLSHFPNSFFELLEQTTRQLLDDTLTSPAGLGSIAGLDEERSTGNETKMMGSME